MQIENALILAAGFGTRMGEIGKTLPKIIWPVFNKSLLELQVHYLKNLGVKKIFINLHYQKDLILKFCRNHPIFDDVTFLIEEEILGVGGAIHNLARQEEVNYQGRLLIVNADQFSFFDRTFWLRAYELSARHNCALFATQVDRKFFYNETTITSEGYLSQILPKQENTTGTHLTYSGFGFVNLERISPHSGASNFFTTVADYKNYSIPMVALPLDFEYWDFGTKERYFDQMLKLRSKSEHNKLDKRSSFQQFLTRFDCNHQDEFYYDDQKNKIKALFLDRRDPDLLNDLSEGDYIIGESQIERIEL